MKLLKIILPLIFILAIQLFAIPYTLHPVHAQELCADDSQCADNIYYKDGTTEQCIHKHLGICDPGSEFTDPNTGCVYVYDTEEDSNLCQTPDPDPGPNPDPGTGTPTPPEEPTPPRIITTPPPEEQAVYSQSQGLLPGFKNSISCNLNPIQQFFSAILSIFKINFCDPETFYKESKFLHQSELPKELVPSKEISIEDQVKGFLGGPTSSYGVSLPTFKNQTGTVAETEKRYEKSHFPAGITPITGR